MKRYFLLFLVAAMLFPKLSDAIESSLPYERITVLMAQINARGHLPAGDMADRYGLSGTIGGGFKFKTDKNYLFALEYSFLFSSNIREDVLASLYTSQGAMINNQGNLEDVNMQMRGHMPFLKAGKIFPVLGPNENSGLFVLAGVGMLHHRIYFHYSGRRRFSQIDDEYGKGYDRLTYGIATSQTIGYFHFSNENTFNFFLGFDFVQGFTRNRRDFNFDEMRKADELRMDLLYGVKGGIFFPFFSRFWDNN